MSRTSTGEPMYLIALTRWSEQHGLEDELPVLAGALNLSPYDARLRLAGPPPLVLASGVPAAGAKEWLAQLRNRGHGAVACPREGVPVPERVAVPRAFELRSGELLLLDERRRTLSLPFDELLGIVRAAELSEADSTLQTKQRKLALGRAVMTGGLLRHKNVTKSVSSSVSANEGVAYLFRKTATDPVLLKEHALAYDGLGPRRAATAHQSFETLVGCLRQAAAHAIYDDRLTYQKRRADLTAVRGTSGERVVSSSNAAANHLAAYILIHAHLQGQV